MDPFLEGKEQRQEMPFNSSEIEEAKKVEYAEKMEMNIVLEKIHAKRRELGSVSTMVIDGIEYPLRKGSVVDQVVAETQALNRVAKEVYLELQGHNPVQEKAVQKLMALLNENEIFVGHYAEIIEHFPKLGKNIAKILPSISLGSEGEQGSF